MEENNRTLNMDFTTIVANVDKVKKAKAQKIRKSNRSIKPLKFDPNPEDSPLKLPVIFVAYPFPVFLSFTDIDTESPASAEYVFELVIVRLGSNSPTAIPIFGICIITKIITKKMLKNLFIYLLPPLLCFHSLLFSRYFHPLNILLYEHNLKFQYHG